LPRFSVLVIVIVVLRVNGLIPKGGYEAINEILTIFIRKARLGVERQKEPGRHLSLPNEFSGFISVILVPTPLGDVEVRSALFDVSLDEPRCRRDKAVPRPFRLVAVAVLACEEEDLARSGTIPLWLPDHRRIDVSAPVWNELHGHPEAHDANQRESGFAHEGSFESRKRNIWAEWRPPWTALVIKLVA
jgi:hypothetical protein